MLSQPNPSAEICCLGCSCLCDDVAVTEQEDGRTSVECKLFQCWLAEAPDQALSACRIEGEAAPLAAGLKRAAAILSGAQCSLVYGLSRASTEAGRAAVAIADRLRGTLDIEASAAARAAQLAYANVGRVSATLGEVRQHGDLVVFWGADPATSHPRHGLRYSLPDERRCVVIGATAEMLSDRPAGWHIPLNSPAEHESALMTLHAIISGSPVRLERAAEASQQPLSSWQELARQLRMAAYGSVFYGEDLTTRRNYELLFRLVRALNQHTRCVCLPIVQPANLAGAVQLLGWSTGYPFAVNFSAGYPRCGPQEYDANRALSRAEVDAALIVASDPVSHLQPAAVDQLRSLPTIVVDWRSSATSERATIFFGVAQPGVHGAGTAYRSDGVPLRLRPWRATSATSDAELLGRLLDRLPTDSHRRT